MAWKLSEPESGNYDDFSYIQDAALSLEPARWSAVAEALDSTMSRPDLTTAGISSMFLGPEFRGRGTDGGC